MTTVCDALATLSHDARDTDIKSAVHSIATQSVAPPCNNVTELHFPSSKKYDDKVQ